MDEIQQEVTPEKQSNFNPMLLVGVLVIVVLAGGLIWHSHKSKNNAILSASAKPMQQKTTPVVTQASTPTPATTSATEEQTVELEAGSFYYKPNEIHVKKGQKVKVTMHSVSMMHDFNIDALDVHMDEVRDGNTGSVEFTADKAGTFEYYCGVGNHRQMGQVGKLIVE